MAIAERYVSALAAGGGAGTSEVTAWTFAEMLTNLVAGQRANVKADAAYTIATAGALSFTASGSTDTLVFIIRGYTATIGDGGRPIITATFGYFDWGFDNGASKMNGIIVQDMEFKGSHTAQPVMHLHNGSVGLRLTVENTAAGFTNNVLHLEDGSAGIACSVRSNSTTLGSAAVYCDNAEAHLIESSVKSLTIGVICNKGFVHRCLIVGDGTGDAGVEFETDREGRVVECTIYDFDDLILISNAPPSDKNRLTVILNCVLYQGINGVNNADTEKTKISVTKCFIGAVTGAQFAGLGDADPQLTITLTANPFVNPATDDYSLNSVAGGGALVRDVALQVPALLP